MNGKMPSPEHEKSTTEELQLQVSDDTRLDVLRVLLDHPDTMLAYRDLGDALDIHWQQPRRILKELEQDLYDVGGRTFEGIVYSEKDGRKMVWQLKPAVRERLEGPEIRVEERTVEKEVPKHESVEDFIRAHWPRIARFEIVYVIIVCLLLVTTESLFNPGFTGTAMAMVLTVSSLGVLAALVIIGYHETNPN